MAHERESVWIFDRTKGTSKSISEIMSECVMGLQRSHPENRTHWRSTVDSWVEGARSPVAYGTAGCDSNTSQNPVRAQFSQSPTV